MANAGIVIYGDSGRIQIDSDYQNLFVVDSGTGGSIPASSSYSGGAVLAYQPSSVKSLSFGATAGSGDKWWVFDILSSSMSSHGYGLVVCTASGKVIFDAIKKPARIAGDIDGSAKIGTTTTFPSGRQYAVVCTSTAGRFTEGSVKAGDGMWENHEKSERVGAKVADNKITVDWYTTNERTSTDPDQQYPQGSTTTEISTNVGFLVLDVTGY